MRTIDEIKGLAHFALKQVGEDGGYGIIDYGKMRGTVIFSWGAGWDHVSVSPYKHSYTPTWEDMCRVREMFFRPEETVLQYHPAQSQYINQMTNCLHLWRAQDYEIPLPPPILVGTKPGMSQSEIERQLAAAYENPYAMTSGMLLRKEGGTA